MACNSPSPSQTNSRAPSPVSGEGKRLDDSSRNGLSSALQGVGAGHLAGGGGPAEQAAMVEGEELPSYSSATRDHAMDIDEIDEGIGMEEDTSLENGQVFGPHQPQWSFNRLDEVSQIDHLPPNNSDAEEDRESLNNGSELSNLDNRMADFAPDEGTVSGAFGDSFPSPPRQSIEWDEPWAEQQYDDEPVAEVKIDEGDYELEHGP